MIYLDSAKTNGNDSIPEKILNNLIQQQRDWDVDGLLPSESMVELEIYYNKTNIFKNLERAYSILALFLLSSHHNSGAKRKSKQDIKFRNLVIGSRCCGLFCLSFIWSWFKMVSYWSCSME